MAKKRPKLITLWLALLSIFIIGLLFYTRCRIECVRIGYEISKETANQKKLNAIINALEIELASLKSPERIEQQVIRHKLGLKMPTPKQIIKIP
jgi:hypothetical protein